MALTKIQTTAIEDDAVTSVKIVNSAITSAKIADATIVSADMAAGAVATSNIASKAITTGLMADGTDGQLFTWDASAVIATVPTGGATQVLTAQGAGAEPVFQDVVDNAAAMALALGG